MAAGRTHEARRPPAFQLRGEIDLASAGALTRELDQYAATTTGDVRIDCRDLTFIDSSGLHVLIRLQRRLGDLGRGVVIENLADPCSRVFRISGLDSLFTLVGNEA
jgi:anti-sigma B factor antagonist